MRAGGSATGRSYGFAQTYRGVNKEAIKRIRNQLLVRRHSSLHTNIWRSSLLFPRKYFLQSFPKGVMIIFTSLNQFPIVGRFRLLYAVSGSIAKTAITSPDLGQVSLLRFWMKIIPLTHYCFMAHSVENKKWGSPCSFKRKPAFISLSSLVWGKSLTFCTRARSFARANDAKIVRSRHAQCKTRESP